MKEKYIVPIINGVGSIKLINGTYNVKAEVAGYDSLTLEPKIVTLSDMSLIHILR